MEELFLPVLHAFENGNSFSGSYGLLRFMLTPKLPKKGEEPFDPVIKAELWHGIYCYEKSEMEQTAEFPMTEDGIEALRAWLWDNREAKP